MLANHPIDIILLAPDLGESRDFSANKLGLKLVSEDEHVLEGSR